MERNARDENAGKGGSLRTLFDDLSLPQVAAGALAAVTSMLLASQIGIYGSVIGVGVGSIVSAVASQLYKKFFTASAEKLRELKPGEPGYVPDGGSGDAPTVVLPPAGETAVLRPTTVRRSLTPRIGDAALLGDVTAQRVRDNRERKRRTQRRIVAVSAVSAMVAVLVSAFAINLITQGEGFGARPEPLVSVQKQEAPQDVGGASVGQGQSGSAGSAANGGSQSSDGHGGSSAGSGSSSAQEGSSNTGGSTSGGSDSGAGSGTSGGSGSGSSGAGGSESGTSGGSGSDAGGDAGGSAGSGSGSGSGTTPGGGSGSSGSGSAAGSDSGSSSGSGSPAGSTTPTSSQPPASPSGGSASVTA
ncbi:hypothetical protein [Paraeggerthella sp.]|uniref:hypothetical protein n=1 Tax=Paraeggerthella sp. TaxID=2897350 RepID=UPI0015EFEF40